MNDFYAGLIAGSAGTIIGHPFDVLKTHSQADQHKNLIQTYRSIIKSYGYKGFYKGLGSPLMSRSIIKGVLFHSYEKSNQSKLLVNSNKYIKMSISGFIAGIPTALILTPVEVIKIMGIRGHSLMQSPKNLKNLMAGTKETMARECLFNVVYFPSYNLLKENNVPLAGGFAGSLSWILTYPLDVIKTMKQLPKHSLTPAQLWYKCGYRGFYNGLSSAMLRAFPTHYTTLKVYEYLKHGI